MLILPFSFVLPPFPDRLRCGLPPLLTLLFFSHCPSHAHLHFPHSKLLFPPNQVSPPFSLMKTEYFLTFSSPYLWVFLLSVLPDPRG